MESVNNQIVDAARCGETEAFGRLYESYYATMVWLAYAILLDRNLAEDAAQQAFVKACEKLGDLKNVDRFGAWLGRICRNEAYQLMSCSSEGGRACALSGSCLSRRGRSRVLPVYAAMA